MTNAKIDFSDGCAAFLIKNEALKKLPSKIFMDEPFSIEWGWQKNGHPGYRGRFLCSRDTYEQFPELFDPLLQVIEKMLEQPEMKGKIAPFVESGKAMLPILVEETSLNKFYLLTSFNQEDGSFDGFRIGNEELTQIEGVTMNSDCNVIRWHAGQDS